MKIVKEDLKMKISTKGRYALRIMVDLAENAGAGFVPLKDIGERQNITVKYLEQIISMLSKAQLVKGMRGNGGGYMLAKKASDCKVGEIFRAAEGKLEICEDEKENGKCYEFWRGFEKAIDNYIDGQSLDDVVKNRNSSRRDPSIWIL